MRQGHQRRGVRPQNGACDGAVGINLRNRMGIGPHLAQQAVGDMAWRVRDHAVGFEVDDVDLGVGDDQPVNGAPQRVTAQIGDKGDLGQRVRVKEMRERRGLQNALCFSECCLGLIVRQVAGGQDRVCDGVAGGFGHWWQVFQQAVDKRAVSGGQFRIAPIAGQCLGPAKVRR